MYYDITKTNTELKPIIKTIANLFLHGTCEHAYTLHIDGSLDALLELLVLASLPTHPDEASAAGQDDEQRRHADTYHSPVWNCTQNSSSHAP